MLCIHKTYTNIHTHRRTWIKNFFPCDDDDGCWVIVVIYYCVIFRTIPWDFIRIHIHAVFNVHYCRQQRPSSTTKFLSLFNLINLFYFNFSNENAKLPNFIFQIQLYSSFTTLWIRNKYFCFQYFFALASFHVLLHHWLIHLTLIYIMSM